MTLTDAVRASTSGERPLPGVAVCSDPECAPKATPSCLPTPQATLPQRQAPTHCGATENAAVSPGASDANLKELIAYLTDAGPAGIETESNATCAFNRARFYDAVAEEAASPRLTYFILKAKATGAKNQHLIVHTGEKSQFDLAWNYNCSPIRDRVLQELGLPVGTWKSMCGEGSGSFSNHSKPGCIR
jgi:hypothetical protein